RDWGSRRPLCSQQWASQAGRTTRTVNAEFGSGKGEHVETALTQAFIGSDILIERDQTPAAQRKNIACERIPFARLDFEQAETAAAKQLHGFDGKPGQIHED